MREITLSELSYERRRRLTIKDVERLRKEYLDHEQAKAKGGAATGGAAASDSSGAAASQAAEGGFTWDKVVGDAKEEEEDDDEWDPAEAFGHMDEEAGDGDGKNGEEDEEGEDGEEDAEEMNTSDEEDLQVGTHTTGRKRVRCSDDEDEAADEDDAWPSTMAEDY